MYSHARRNCQWLVARVHYSCWWETLLILWPVYSGGWSRCSTDAISHDLGMQFRAILGCGLLSDWSTTSNGNEEWINLTLYWEPQPTFERTWSCSTSSNLSKNFFVSVIFDNQLDQSLSVFRASSLPVDPYVHVIWIPVFWAAYLVSLICTKCAKWCHQRNIVSYF